MLTAKIIGIHFWRPQSTYCSSDTSSNFVFAEPTKATEESDNSLKRLRFDCSSIENTILPMNWQKIAIPPTDQSALIHKIIENECKKSPTSQIRLFLDGGEKWASKHEGRLTAINTAQSCLTIFYHFA